MRNGGELSDLAYLPMKTEYPQNAAMHTPHLFGTFTQHNSIFNPV